MRFGFRSILVLVLASAAWGQTRGSAAADIYRRVDGAGVVHYTNIQPKTGPGWKRVLRSGSARQTTPAERASRSARRTSASRRAELWRSYEAFVREAAQLYKLPVPFLRAVMRVESNFSPRVVSRAGAMGLMQLMPATAASMGVRDPFDPRENILGGARYLRVLANLFNGDLLLTIAAYNAGHAAVLRHKGVPPYAETQRYVRRVLKHYYAYRGH